MGRPGVARTMRLALVMTVAAAVLVGTLAASAAPQPVARVVTGAGPCGAASGFGSVWVAVYGTGRLVRIDARSNRVVARIRVAGGICPIIVAAGSVWVASDMTNMLYRIDPRGQRIVARIRVANWPAHVTAAFGSVWVSAYERGTVARVDPRRNRVSRVYAVGGNPSGLAEADEGATKLELDEQVTFSGPKRDEALRALLRQHKILVVPSRYDEPFGVMCTA